MTQSLIEKSRWLRKELFNIVVKSGKGHFPSSSSCADFIIGLFYKNFINLNPNNLNSRSRDRIIISKGHAAMVLYPILADLGFFPKKELENFCKPEGLLRMYADNTIPGIESITGSLGHGLGIGAGYCLAAKRDNIDFKTYVVIGDGECYEGSVWETAMFASHHKLNNLIAVVDKNELCIMGKTEELITLGSLESKWEAFGWNVFSIDGHKYSEIIPTLRDIKNSNTEQPTAIILNTVKGKGVSFMEGQHLWHNRMPNEGETKQALKELEKGCIFQ